MPSCAHSGCLLASGGEPAPRPHLILNVGQHDLWWCPKSNGYTSNVLKAGVYTANEAHNQHRSRASDLPYIMDEAFLRHHLVNIADESVAALFGLRMVEPLTPPYVFERDTWVRIHAFAEAIAHLCSYCGKGQMPSSVGGAKNHMHGVPGGITGCGAAFLWNKFDVESRRGITEILQGAK